MSATPNTLYARERYGAVPAAPSATRSMRAAKALLIIVGADGKVSDAEMGALCDLAALMGAPPEVIAEYKAFDYRNGKLADYLEGLTDDSSTRRLLYDAIKIASVDGFHDEERASARRAAELLGVDGATLRAIESLVMMEAAQAELRRATLLLG